MTPAALSSVPGEATLFVPYALVKGCSFILEKRAYDLKHALATREDVAAR